MSVYGYNIPEELHSIREEVGMGVCPQHDVLYPDMTVAEHLRLFAGIKGVARKDMDKEIKETIEVIGLTEKVHCAVHE